MPNIVMSWLLLPLFAVLPLTLNAAPANQAASAVLSATRQVEGVAESQVKTDLNSADALTLQQNLNGIGKAKAEAIVAYREAHGPFQSVDELLEIKGIGNALLERNRDRLVVE
ncbi:helix-hairpin-helix domain-containing protein [Pseudomonas sp. RC3H12]|uniref:ComEA family DNA-binding protein n=1 Tax=Pseudomonas sp. RC3H12 TaxID=2834406 RepID=UPI001BDE45B7|nr:helix-hairpin-helix domain-containing protein [Pseudomonas sp. RC3H12]QWA29962.1 helix-hairpin-helix domain-containing protein [Pseudomonas sp. RC3H12]